MFSCTHHQIRMENKLPTYLSSARTIFSCSISFLLDPPTTERRSPVNSSAWLLLPSFSSFMMLLLLPLLRGGLSLSFSFSRSLSFSSFFIKSFLSSFSLFSGFSSSLTAAAGSTPGSVFSALPSEIQRKSPDVTCSDKTA